MASHPSEMRLQKYLAHAGLCSRRKAEEYILAGRVKINHQVVKKLGTKIVPGKDHVSFDNKPVGVNLKTAKVYIALNKPAGYVTSCSQQNDKIILDLIDIQERIYPIGRLDKDSDGLVLLTNDGDLHHRLSHPSYNHEKEYIVTTGTSMSDHALKRMAQGMMINNVKTRKAKVNRLSKNKFSIVLKQGLNRQIRKMVGKTGNTVSSLTRIRMADVHLGRLKQGHWRYLSQKEIRNLTQF